MKQFQFAGHPSLNSNAIALFMACKLVSDFLHFNSMLKQDGNILNPLLTYGHFRPAKFKYHPVFSTSYIQSPAFL